MWLKRLPVSVLGFTPQVCSTFYVHLKEVELRGECLAELVEKIMAEEQATLSRPHMDGELIRVLADKNRLLSEVQPAHQEHRRLWHVRPRTASAIVCWIGITLTYFRKRNHLKKPVAYLPKFLPDTCHLTVPR
jgi:hypothetical protein